MIGRVLITVVVAASIAFFLGMAAWTTQDSYLECHRTADSSIPQCVNDKFYPFSIATHETLPSIRGVRVEERISRGRGGSHEHLVLVLDHGATTSEFPGIGKSGVNAPAVAAEIGAFLGDASRERARWHLRESVYPVTALMFAFAVAMGMLAGLAFRRTTIAFEPGSRVVTVRVGRWPARAKPWTAKIDDIQRVERIESFDHQSGVKYSVQLIARGAASHALGLGLRDPLAADAVIKRIDEQLAGWRA